MPRSSIHGVHERVDRTGEVVAPLRLERLEELAARLREERVEAIAISFLWSFLNPRHERQLRDWLTAGNGSGQADWFVTASSDLAPVIREYERTATTVLNATSSRRARLPQADGRPAPRRGHRGAISVMHSAGGVSSLDEARERGVTLLSSGPAGGMLGARELARRLELDPVATDVGGTSFDIGTIVDGEPVRGHAGLREVPRGSADHRRHIDRRRRGSIAWIEPETGVLKVGPQSAGASPGPAC